MRENGREEMEREVRRVLQWVRVEMKRVGRLESYLGDKMEFSGFL